MASVKAYDTAKGKRYRVRYRTPEGKQTDKRGFPTIKAAEAFANRVEVDKLDGQYISPTDSKRTVEELGQPWLDRQLGHLKPSAYRPLEVAWRLRIKPRWGDVQLGSIKHSAVQQWLTDLGQGAGDIKPVGATVVIRTHQVFAAMLEDAVRDRLIKSNPARKMKLPRKPKRRPLYLDHAQVDLLASKAGEHETLILFLSYTGLRWGEATGMRVSDLNMLRRRATVDENAVEVGNQIVVGTAKGHKRRTVPLPEFLIPYLARQCERKGRSDLLFPGEDGGYLGRPHTTSGWFDKAVTAAGVPRVTPHDLRHTAASLSVSAGANVKAIQKMLGHASAAMTLDVYADLFDDDLEVVATALSEARTKAGVGRMWAEDEQTAADRA